MTTRIGLSDRQTLHVVSKRRIAPLACRGTVAPMSADQATRALRSTSTNVNDAASRAAELLQARVASDRQSRLPSPALILSSHQTTAKQPDGCPSWMPRGPVGECFGNALRVVTQIVIDPRLEHYRYAEGYAYHPKLDLLVEHAWIESRDGVVYDPTWSDPTDCAYIGITFPHQQVLSGYLEAQVSLLFGDWVRGFRVLRSHMDCCAVPAPGGTNY